MRPFAESPRHFSQNLRSSFLSSAGFLPFRDAPGISSSDRTHEDDAPAIFILAQSRVWPTSLASVGLIKIPPDNLAFLKVVYYLRKIKGQNESPASRGQNSIKQKENIGNHGPTDMQILTESLIRNFHESVSTGPLYICTCCDQLWYRHSVFPANQLTLKNPDMVKYLQNIVSVDNIKWACQTCSGHLKKGKVPPCAIVNGMQFPTKPNFCYLNELECRLIAPRLAFQKIYQAPRGGQLKITGNVVNVPADVNSTVNMLPRLADDTCTIKVQLKRRLQYKSSALSLNIRPNKVMQAAAWLVNTSPLYQDQGITIDENWLREVQNSLDETNIFSAISNDTDSQTIENSVEDEWSEDETDIPAGVTDTMLTPDYVDNSERQQIYNIAPREGNTPLSVFRDQYSEEMAYPGIFLGQKRPNDKQRLKSVY